MNNPYFQFSGGIVAALILLATLFLFFIFLPVSMVAEAFSKLGLTPIQGILMLIAILVGRSVNIPIYTSERLVMVKHTRFANFSMGQFAERIAVEDEPAHELKKQVLAVNFGGCIMPLLLSITFLMSLHMSGQPSMAYGWVCLVLTIVSIGCYTLVRSDPYTGLRVPLVLPGGITFLSVFFLVPGELRPVVAYVAGSMGTIIGGNIIPLLTPRIRSTIGTPVVSIGGAGTFWGVFVAGMLAVLLA